MVIAKSKRATQLACQKRVRGNDRNAKLTVSFSLTSLWLRGATERLWRVQKRFRHGSEELQRVV